MFLQFSRPFTNCNLSTDNFSLLVAIHLGAMCSIGPTPNLIIYIPIDMKVWDHNVRYNVYVKNTALIELK